jgi:hypothetical protein
MIGWVLVSPRHASISVNTERQFEVTIRLKH